MVPCGKGIIGDTEMKPLPTKIVPGTKPIIVKPTGRVRHHYYPEFKGGGPKNWPDHPRNLMNVSVP